MKKVFVVGKNFLHYFKEMYEKRGYTLVKNMEDADIVQFTGGADIDPKFYNQHDHRTTSTSPYRDEEESAAYKKAQELSKFCAGVCRGGQLLNALNGGSMYQHVENHAMHGCHGMEDVETGEVIPVSSMHHQMMILGKKAKLLGKSTEMRSKYKRNMTELSDRAEERVDLGEALEVEACYYPETKSFCYQPHPEFVTNDHPCQQWYFDKMEELYAKV